MTISPAFQSFARQAPTHHAAWLQAVAGLGTASALDGKTQSLVYMASSQPRGWRAALPFTFRKPRCMAPRETRLSVPFLPASRPSETASCKPYQSRLTPSTTTDVRAVKTVFSDVRKKARVGSKG